MEVSLYRHSMGAKSMGSHQAVLQLLMRGSRDTAEGTTRETIGQIRGNQPMGHPKVSRHRSSSRSSSSK